MAPQRTDGEIGRANLEQALGETFEDCCLSKNERHALHKLFEDFKNDVETLHFARNRAFDLVAEHMRTTGEHRVEALKWLEQVVRGIDSAKEQQLCGATSAHFSPGTYCVNQILWLIRAARSSIDVCVFTISDDRISSELIKAHQRGIKVRVLSDNDKSQDRGNDIERFAKEGMPVKIDSSPSHMHHKFAIFDGRVLVNGSFNWTRSASTNNQENIVVMGDPSLVSSFSHEFARLWDKCVTV